MRHPRRRCLCAPTPTCANTPYPTVVVLHVAPSRAVEWQDVRDTCAVVLGEVTGGPAARVRPGVWRVLSTLARVAPKKNNRQEWDRIRAVASAGLFADGRDPVRAMNGVLAQLATTTPNDCNTEEWARVREGVKQVSAVMAAIAL